MDLSFLPQVNALLNATGAVLLIVGRIQIKRGRIDAHRRTMIIAFAVSAVFLVSYVTHYYWRIRATGTTHTFFQGAAWIKTLYYLMLVSHIMLAMTVPVLAVTLIVLGLKKRFAIHKKIARFAWPIWMYVSITGVLIYFMLYKWNPW